MRRTARALLSSLVFTITVASIETLAGPGRRSVLAFDAVFSWPASLCGRHLHGHGIEMVLPFFFSVLFYAALIWLLLLTWEKLHPSGEGLLLHRSTPREHSESPRNLLK